MPESRPHPLQLRFWGGHVLLIVALIAAVLLAWWQYAAWDAARDQAARDLSKAPARALADVMGPDDTFPGQDLGRRVKVDGSWMPESTLYVSDRKHDGKVGYWVLTPVRVGDSAMPVVRGWSAKPTAPAVEGDVTLTGWLHASEADRPGDDDPHDDIISAVRIGTMTEHVDRDLYSAYVVAQEPTASLVAVPNDAVPPVSSNTALRNLLYAVQWLLFGGFAGFIWWRWLQDTRKEAATEGEIDSRA